ncbi:MAG TPA: MBG domain-containing protein, partial [Acidimicrobiales bacterium]|nr:MBG domain-containing protein [Acidimicrobiales bacterium]
ATNYTLTDVASSATVDPATLTVTASPTTSDYGAAPTVTPIYSGLKNGDQASVVVTSAPVCTSSVLATTGVGTYPNANTCSGGAATNYTLTDVASSATVDPAPSTP